MRYAVPATALVGLVCLATMPVPVIWGLLIGVGSLVLIVGIALTRWFDRALDAVLRRQTRGHRRRDVYAGTGIGRGTRRG